MIRRQTAQRPGGLRNPRGRTQADVREDNIRFSETGEGRFTEPGMSRVVSAAGPEYNEALKRGRKIRDKRKFRGPIDVSDSTSEELRLIGARSRLRRAAALGRLSLFGTQPQLG